MNTSAGQEQIRSRLDELLRSVGRNLETAHPTELTGMTFGQETVLGLFVSCGGLFAAVQPLVERGLAEEARILLRTLLADTTRLQYFRTNAPKLEELAVRFLRDSLFEERRLACEARAIGYTWPDQFLMDINNQIIIDPDYDDQLGRLKTCSGNTIPDACWFREPS